jgi:RimJ/RimL family protein N-acetyltransferase
VTAGSGSTGAALAQPTVPPADDVIALVPLGRTHLDPLEDLGADPLVQRVTRIPDPFGRAEAEWWLGLYERGWVDGSRAGFAVVDRSDGTFVGMIAFVTLRLDAAEAEVGYIVAPRARGRGIAVRALTLVSEWGFTALGLARIELRAELDNPASLKVAERCGYVREGVLRHVFLKGGRRGDMALYARLATDPVRLLRPPRPDARDEPAGPRR